MYALAHLSSLFLPLQFCGCNFYVFFASTMLATCLPNVMFLSFIPLLIFKDQGLKILKLLIVLCSLLFPYFLLHASSLFSNIASNMSATSKSLKTVAFFHMTSRICYMVTHVSKISAILGKNNFTNNFDTQPGEPEMSQECIFLYYRFLSLFIAAERDSTSDTEKVLRFLRLRHLANTENYASLPIPFLT